MSIISELFESMVFGNRAMSEKLPKDTYQKLKITMSEGKPLDITLANVVANAMKEWAIEKGATHFTHWFQPMTGITAEKHDSFIAIADSGKAIMEFSGKELIKGEPDASSFPSGGLRATFEARGYTAWDPTSYAFVKGHTLYIPTAFYSYSGEALDKKTPLLRSMEAINTQAMRILRLFGHADVTSVKTTVGAEQEYFLVDKKLYKQREDLIFCGRTLFGAPPPKGQELEDHYFGALNPRVSAYMHDLNKELWKLGILAKTEHNEVAPSQHELAPVFSTTNTATDQNQLTMDVMKAVADKHGLVCLLHEKPFEGINGSGKHNNWSMSSSTGVNLLEPGNSPYENAQFLLFLCAVIKGVDEYQDLLRASVASAGNDHRLGANEAPPAIISIFLGNQLTEILEAFEKGERYSSDGIADMKTDVHVLPNFPKDATDRNRTSPFAFTGNKFEFRMLGASLSLACPNIMLNTIVAEELMQFADILEKSKDFDVSVKDIIKNTIKNHKRIIFNGNNYSKEWKEEAAKRGLCNLKATPDAVPELIAEKNLNLFKKHSVYSASEIRSRHDVILENYCKVLDIEAKIMIKISKQEILPAVISYEKDILKTIDYKKCLDVDYTLEKHLAANLSSLNLKLWELICELEKAFYSCELNNLKKRAVYYKDFILPAMQNLRITADKLEGIVAKVHWPHPTYSDLLFGV